MNSSDIPSRTLKAFAVNGNKNTIPVDSSTTTLNNGQATMDSGFPPITMISRSAGGRPPGGKDFNGILYSVSMKQQWQDAGMSYPFNADFSTSISGYPKGAILPNSALSGQWLNTIDGNTSTPEISSSASTGWVPFNDYGVTSITGLSNVSVTLTTLQASKDRIILSGTLTSNINLVVPAWLKKWTIINNCSGNFNVIVKTPAGSGVVVPNGLTANVIGDGTNIVQDDRLLGYPGRLLNVRKFSTPGTFTYTETPGTKFVIVEGTGAGGAGGGTVATNSSQVSIGSGGSSGGYGVALITSGFSGASLVIGQGGIPSAGNNGGNGGNSSFGSSLVFPGGNGGAGGGAISNTAYTYSGNTLPGSEPTGANIKSTQGQVGGTGFYFSGTGAQSGPGGNSAMMGGGGGYPVTIGSNGNNGGSFGSGGSGAAGNTSNSSRPGGAGSDGCIIIWEYS